MLLFYNCNKKKRDSWSYLAVKVNSNSWLLLLIKAPSGFKFWASQMKNHQTCDKGPHINYVVSVEGGEGGSPKDDLLHRPYLIKKASGEWVRNRPFWDDIVYGRPHSPLCLSTIVAHLKLKITLKLGRETYFIRSSFIFFFRIYFCTKSHAHKKILSESTKVVTDASMGLGPVVQNPSKSKWNTKCKLLLQ